MQRRIISGLPRTSCEKETKVEKGNNLDDLGRNKHGKMVE